MTSTVDLVAKRLSDGAVPVRVQIANIPGYQESVVLARGYVTSTLSPGRYQEYLSLDDPRRRLLQGARSLTVGVVTDGGYNFVATDDVAADFRTLLAGAMQSAADQYRNKSRVDAIRNQAGETSIPDDMSATGPAVPTANARADDIEAALATIDARLTLLGFDMPVRTYLDNETDILTAFKVVANEVSPDIGFPAFYAPLSAPILRGTK